MTVTIYHNPRCSKSRQTLALLEKRGIAPRVVDYLKTPTLGGGAQDHPQDTRAQTARSHAQG